MADVSLADAKAHLSLSELVNEAAVEETVRIIGRGKPRVTPGTIYFLLGRPNRRRSRPNENPADGSLLSMLR